MNFVLIKHPLVESDIERVLDFLAEYSGLEVAERKSAEIEQTFRQLSEFPHIGTVRSEISVGLRAIPSAEKGVIFFTVDDHTKSVKIVCVTYAGQDWQKIAREREQPDLPVG